MVVYRKQNLFRHIIIDCWFFSILFFKAKSSVFYMKWLTIDLK